MQPSAADAHVKCSNVNGPLARVANSLLSQELKLCFSDTKFTKAPYTKKDTRFFLDTK